MDEKHAVILFDGVCNLCNKSVQFVIQHDAKKQFRYASLQSQTGKNILKEYGLLHQNLASFILIQNGKAYTKSTAALRVAKALNGGWHLLYACIIIPAFIRNAVYNVVAANRYKWFGKQESCWVPTKDLESLFLD